jgi:PAS domain S-box-containing protein
MADLVRAHNWAATSVGPIESWPDALLSAVNLMLSCQFPALICWGPQMLQFYNDKFCPLLADKHPSALGQSARACWKEAWQIISPQFEAVLAHGEAVYQERVLVPVLRDGRLQNIYWTYSYSPIYSPLSEIDGILIVCHDVTDEIVATQNLRESEERLRLALAAANGVGTWDWDVTNDLVYADSGFARLYGVSPAQAAAGITIAEFTRNIHPEDRDRVQKAITVALHTGEEFSCEYRLLQVDDSIRWVVAVGRATFGPNGTPTRFPGVTLDITERKYTENALRESEARLSAIYNTILEYIGIITPAGVILDCNRASLEFAGNTLEDVIGKNFWDTPWFSHTPGAPEMVKQAVARAAAGEFLRQEVSLIRPSGDAITFDFSLTPVRDESGKVVFLIPEGRDVTDLKRAESALMQSEKLAAVGRLASSIAHEINNPLESVMNLIYLAQQHAVDRDALRFLGLADQEIRRVSLIANQTLRFHKQPSNPQAVGCSDLFQTVLAIYEGRFRNSKISVERRERATQPIICFEGDIRQVLNNLVANAVDAMPSGGRLLLRSREATHGPTNRKGIALTVADTGIGMTQAVLKNIFNPFFTTKGISGTGLGLWVSQEIVTRHKGALSVRSTRCEGHSGTVFTLFLPYDAAVR